MLTVSTLRALTRFIFNVFQTSFTRRAWRHRNHGCFGHEIRALGPRCLGKRNLEGTRLLPETSGKKPPGIGNGCICVNTVTRKRQHNSISCLEASVSSENRILVNSKRGRCSGPPIQTTVGLSLERKGRGQQQQPTKGLEFESVETSLRPGVEHTVEPKLTQIGFKPRRRMLRGVKSKSKNKAANPSPGFFIQQDLSKGPSALFCVKCLGDSSYCARSKLRNKLPIKAGL